MTNSTNTTKLALILTVDEDLAEVIAADLAAWAEADFQLDLECLFEHCHDLDTAAVLAEAVHDLAVLRNVETELPRSAYQQVVIECESWQCDDYDYPGYEPWEQD